MRLFLSVWRAIGLIVLAVVMVLAYVRVGLEVGAGQPLMPVDDAYIHFQYAKQAALGQPFVYNPSDGATSGATSLIYPFLLSIGWSAGLRELSLGYWAMFIGFAGLAASGIFTRRIVIAIDGKPWLAECSGAALIVSGTVVWHAASGMETLLACALMLATLDGFLRNRKPQLLIAAALLTVTRPEGGLLAGLACAIAFFRALRADGFSARLVLYGLPVLLMGLQPLINIALTGSASATGGQAKSLLSLIPPDLGYIFERILTNFARMWGEFFTGYSEGGVWYLPPLMGCLAVLGALVMARRRPAAVLLLALWVLSLTGAISTLDTAFWHFKRYQMPLLVLVFPLTGWLLSRFPRLWAMVSSLVMVVAAAVVGWPFLSYYQHNTESVAAQPLQMATWFRQNAPDARVAVHDVGMMRYYGEVYTIDMVGLTTTGAAEAWRNGVGAVTEWLIKQRPDYYAAYDDARGLNYLVDVLTTKSEGIIAEFVHDFDPATNVALGGRRQVIIPMPDASAWSDPLPQNGLITPVLAEHYMLLDTVDVADLTSEAVHAYQWTSAGRGVGFPSEVYQFSTLGCDANCVLSADSGRRITASERFTVTGAEGKDHVLVTRVHPVSDTTVTLWANGTLMSESFIPTQPGQWFELWTVLPAQVMSDESLELDIMVQVTGGAYMPYYHWFYAETTPPSAENSADVAVVFETAKAALAPVELIQTEERLTVRLTWEALLMTGVSAGDAVGFVHLYADLDHPPVVQMDIRPGRGAYPPINWREPITGFTDEFVLDLATLPTGRYTLAVGLYRPVTFERFAPQILLPTYQEREGRVIVGQIVVK